MHFMRLSDASRKEMILQVIDRDSTDQHGVGIWHCPRGDLLRETRSKEKERENVSEAISQSVVTEIHRTIEQERDRESSGRIAQFLYRHRFSPPFDSRQNAYPRDNVHV